MITCYLRYKIDMYKVAEFEAYARMWIQAAHDYAEKTRCIISYERQFLRPVQ